jgi:hypothetical protein
MMTFYTRGYAPTLGIPTIPTFKFEEKRPNAHGPTGSSSTSFFFGGIELLLLLFYIIPLYTVISDRDCVCFWLFDAHNLSQSLS